MTETASWPRRVLALAVDWFASTLVVIGLIGPGGWLEDPASGFYVLGVFALESTILTTLAGGSFGKLAIRLRVVRNDGSGRPLELLPALVRTVLVCMVVPPLIFRPDGRGLHDLAVNSTTVRIQ